MSLTFSSSYSPSLNIFSIRNGNDGSEPRIHKKSLATIPVGAGAAAGAALVGAALRGWLFGPRAKGPTTGPWGGFLGLMCLRTNSVAILPISLPIRLPSSTASTKWTPPQSRDEPQVSSNLVRRKGVIGLKSVSKQMRSSVYLLGPRVDVD